MTSWINPTDVENDTSRKDRVNHSVKGDEYTAAGLGREQDYNVYYRKGEQIQVKDNAITIQYFKKASGRVR